MLGLTSVRQRSFAIRRPIVWLPPALCVNGLSLNTSSRSWKCICLGNDNHHPVSLCNFCITIQYLPTSRGRFPGASGLAGPPHFSSSFRRLDIGASANLELVDKFCCLRNMLSVDGNADAALEARIQTGWNKFRQLVPLLANSDISFIGRGRLYSSCVRSSTGMLQGSETWPVRKENEVALQRVEMRMVSWMCNVKVKDRVPSKELRERLGIDDIILILQQNRLWWYGHVLQKEDTD